MCGFGALFIMTWGTSEPRRPAGIRTHSLCDGIAWAWGFSAEAVAGAWEEQRGSCTAGFRAVPSEAGGVWKALHSPGAQVGSAGGGGGRRRRICSPWRCREWGRRAIPGSSLVFLGDFGSTRHSLPLAPSVKRSCPGNKEYSIVHSKGNLFIGSRLDYMTCFHLALV